MPTRALALGLLLLCLLASPLAALDRPWIGDTFFYWYTWDYDTEMGGWIGGIYNTPLQGYYDSRRYEDNLASLHTAAEWGITHHFMDYWGPGWQDLAGNPREDLLIRATEKLQQDGYDTFMSVYQDGTDFDMAQFSKNLDPGRDTEFYATRFAKSPAYPTIDGKPVFLIYGRNGRPKTTATDEGFRQWLEGKYETLDRLNARWGTGFGAFDEIGVDFGVKGHQRAESIKYLFELWEEEMGRVHEAAQERCGLPGCLFSWDVGYQPFAGYGYSDQMKVFAGPHSYGGIFGVPHAEDVERFIQAQVAKRYGTVFFDTFKNFYHDWEIRIPGTCYPPDFCAFDRFWVQALGHYAEALFHLSWNEWWEGSNLEPCYEYGKTYCEKNLLYSTIMKQCFDSIREWNRGAKVAVLLNDWHWLAGGRNPADIYSCIQALRRNNIRFDLLPDDFVTRRELDRFDVVLAPAGGVGFGYNSADEPIADLLLGWAEEGDRRLLISRYPGLAGRLSLGRQLARDAGAAEAGPDMNLFVDVGKEGDEEFLVDGCSGREDWGKLEAGQFGATDREHTVRWTPAAGATTTLLVPLSPHRDHTLRISGTAIWDNHVAVSLNGARVAEFDLSAGKQEVETIIPAAAVGGLAFGELVLTYSQANVPGERDPERYDDGRVCNLAIDWVQLCTAGQAFSTEKNYTMPQSGARFGERAPVALAGRTLSGPYAEHDPLAVTDGTLSTYATDGAARDVVCGPAGNVLYVNGAFSGVGDEIYLDAMLADWADARSELNARAEDILTTVLTAGDTDIILAYNYAAPEPRELRLQLADTASRPVVEISPLSRDGRRGGRLMTYGMDASLSFSEQIDYYAVYQITRGPVRVSTPLPSVVPGESRTVQLDIENRLRGPRAGEVTGTVSVVPHLPSLTSDKVTFTVAKEGRTTVPLTLVARHDLDWGDKTVVLDVEVGGRHSYFWRTVTVERLPRLRIEPRVLPAGAKEARIRNPSFPWARTATAGGVSLSALGGRSGAQDVADGRAVEVTLPAPAQPGPEPGLHPLPVELSYAAHGVAGQAEALCDVATCPSTYPRPADALAPLVVANPHREFLENCLVAVALDEELRDRVPVYVREAGGNVVPSQVWDGELRWIAMLPPRSLTVYTLCRGEAAESPTDLRVETDGGAVTVGNSVLALGWDGTRGGTVTSLLSHRTGLDYGAGSFGIGFGTWGQFDPHKPAINTVDFVKQESKTWQRDAEGRAEVKVLRQGPVSAEVEVTATVEGAECRQRYVVSAYQNAFHVTSDVKLPMAAQEVVALDARLARNGLEKIFPNFTGLAAEMAEDQPTGGWRQAPYTPPYATMMKPPAYGESISLLGSAEGDKTMFRQGFWPQDRPEPGPVIYSQIEYIARETAQASASAWVLLHEGYQVFARRYLESRLQDPPTVIRPESFAWEGELPAAEVPADWWNAHWHYSLPVTVSVPAGAPGRTVALKPDFPALLGGRGELDPASPRAVAGEGPNARLLPATYSAETEEVFVALPSGSAKEGAQELAFVLYFDTLAHGPKPPVAPEVGRAGSVLNGSFEEGAAHWSLPEGALQTTGAHTGEGCIRLQWTEGQGPVLAANGSMGVTADTDYRVTFWARTETPGASIRSNFYISGDYDFPQAATELIADGQWHRYETIRHVGRFPPDGRPALRLWVLGEPQTVWLDDVSAEPVTARPQAAEMTVQFGEPRRTGP